MTATEHLRSRRSTTPISRIKRWIAVVGVLVVVATMLVLFGAISFTVSETGDGSDPDRAFSATQEIPGGFAADLVWSPDADGLVREVETTTREQLGSMWLRADDALARAAEGDTGGLEVWFVDAALGAAVDRFVSGGVVDVPHASIEVAPAIAHRLRVEFYSLDGQVVVLAVDTIRVRPVGTADQTAEVVEELEVVAVLSDGNWRIRHLERLTPRTDEDTIPT